MMILEMGESSLEIVFQVAKLVRVAVHNWKIELTNRICQKMNLLQNHSSRWFKCSNHRLDGSRYQLVTQLLANGIWLVA